MDRSSTEEQRLRRLGGYLTKHPPGRYSMMEQPNFEEALGYIEARPHSRRGYQREAEQLVTNAIHFLREDNNAIARRLEVKRAALARAPRIIALQTEPRQKKCKRSRGGRRRRKFVLPKIDLTDLPGNVIIRILSNLTLPEQIPLRRVTNRFQHLIDARFALVRKSLKVFTSLLYLRFYANEMVDLRDRFEMFEAGKCDDLVLSELGFDDEPRWEQLGRWFPQLDSLLVHMGRMCRSQLLIVPKTLHRFVHLSELTIMGKCVTETSVMLIPQFCESINKLTQLSELNLRIVQRDEWPVAQLANILSRLVRFSLSVSNYTETHSVMELIGPQCRHLGFYYDSTIYLNAFHDFESPTLLVAEDLDKWPIEFGRDRIGRLETLELHQVAGQDVLGIVCQHFRSLRHLSLSFRRDEPLILEFRNMNHFEKLRQLTTLQLRNIQITRYVYTHYPVQPLYSVTRLCLYNVDFVPGQPDNTLDRFMPELASVFPNVEELAITTTQALAPNVLKPKVYHFPYVDHHRIECENPKGVCGDGKQFGRHRDKFIDKVDEISEKVLKFTDKDRTVTLFPSSKQ